MNRVSLFGMRDVWTHQGLNKCVKRIDLVIPLRIGD